MTTATTRPTAVERLTLELFDGAAGDALAEEVAAWLSGSRRFRAFAEANRDKIRKKLRGARDAEARWDVLAELRAAQLLLADRRIELTFEAYGSRKPGPDFTVVYRAARSFNLEVTRMRRSGDAARHRLLLAKLRQLPPSIPNVLVVAIEGDTAEAFDVAAATRALLARATATDETFFTMRGFRGTREFHDRYLRLGAVMVWCEAAAVDGRATLWINRSARIAAPERALGACFLSLRAG